MGEIAEAMSDGECCQVCGVFFEIPYGYPVTCAVCGGGADEEQVEESV